MGPTFHERPIWSTTNDYTDCGGAEEEINSMAWTRQRRGRDKVREWWLIKLYKQLIKTTTIWSFGATGRRGEEEQEE